MRSALKKWGNVKQQAKDIGEAMSEKISLKDQTTEPERGDALSYREKPNFSPTANSSHDISFLQRTIGNRALFGLFKSGTLRPKLKIGQPNDTYEQEADRVAGQVIGNNYSEKPNLSNTITTIQRFPAEGETTTTTVAPPSEVTRLQPLNAYDLFNMFKIRISCDDYCFFLQCSGNHKTVSVRDGVLSFDFSSLDYVLQTIPDNSYGEGR
jgi:hypothetical protein